MSGVEQITCLRIANRHSITYHQSMARARIRLARSDDSHALADLRYRFRTETEPATETKRRFLRRCASWMKKRFRSGAYPWRCWVVDDGEQLLGHVCVQLFEKIPNPVDDEPELHAYVTNFYVVPEMRSQGVGKRLLNKALSWCHAQGTDAIILWATPQVNRSISCPALQCLRIFLSCDVTAEVCCKTHATRSRFSSGAIW
jgi:GNAT superfamily N-acetyltransferase